MVHPLFDFLKVVQAASDQPYLLHLKVELRPGILGRE